MPCHKPDYELIAKRFKQASCSYRQHATVQQAMAKKLATLLINAIHESPRLSNSPLSIFEIGCGTGFLTEQLLSQVNVCQYVANDLYEQAHDDIATFISDEIKDYQFIQGDIQQVNSFPNPVDIIAGGAVLQWVTDSPTFFSKLYENLLPQGIVALSGFSSKNYQEIRQITGQGLSYLSPQSLAGKIAPHFKIHHNQAEEIRLFFDSPLAVLKHMRRTGVNGLSQSVWSRRDLANFNDAYEVLKTEKGYPLTYHPLFILLQKK